MESTKNQKRIIKNTVMLYIRMAVIMLVTLFTTRVVLDVLGETDYGIYTIVGSVVVSLVFIQNTLISSTQRFISYELGRGEEGRPNEVFSMSLNIHLIFMAAVVLLLETIGLWFLNSVLNIPADRMYAANVVYQLTIATFCVNLYRIPYNATIISQENMDIYAILSIAEAILKLAIVYALLVLSYDKLITYSVLVFAVTLIINLMYITYCKKKFPSICSYRLIKDRKLFKEMSGFLGWNLLGGVTGVATNEGPNYFMNAFLGVRINAAMGIAKQVSSAVYQFTSNFQMAFNPQIVKSYAAGDKEALFDLIYKSSAVSFYLMFIIAFPFILCSDVIFNLWLVEVPEYAIEFCILMMLSQLVAALSSPLWMVAHAIGNIKNYQICISTINLLIIPISWGVLYFKYSPLCILAFLILINVLVFVYRLLYLRSKIAFPCFDFFKKVIWKCIYQLILIVPLPILLTIFIPDTLGSILAAAISLIISIVVFLYVGLTKEYRNSLWIKIKNRI